MINGIKPQMKKCTELRIKPSSFDEAMEMFCNQLEVNCKPYVDGFKQWGVIYMMRLLSKKQICMEGGCMLRIKTWLIVKYWYIRYYLTHPSIGFKMVKLMFRKRKWYGIDDWFNNDVFSNVFDFNMYALLSCEINSLVEMGCYGLVLWCYEW